MRNGAGGNAGETLAMPWNKRFDQQEALERALDTFWAQGYTGTSIQDLVDRMGINRASLYDTYGDKQELFLAALRAYDDHYRATWFSELEALDSPLRAVKRVFYDLIESFEAGELRYGCFTVNTSLEYAPHHEGARREVARSQHAILEFFHRKLVEARHKGEIAADLDTETTASSLLATFIGMQAIARSGTDIVSFRAVADGALACLG